MIGFGVCGFGALFQLRQDVIHSHAEIKESVSVSMGSISQIAPDASPLPSSQADKYRIGLEERVAALEAAISGKAVKSS